MEITEQIRQAASITEIASQYTTLRRRGRKFVGLCPFHSEKFPSFTVDDEKQLYHCFGCGAGGDVFTLVMEKESLSFPEALKYLAEKYNITLPERKKLSPQHAKLEEQLFKINEDALAFFRKNLFKTREGEKALRYLEKRNISEEVIQKLKIGYALNSWDSLLSFFQEKKISPELLEKAGLVIRREKKEGYYDRFRGRIIFPIFTLTGKVVAFGGRTIIDAEPKYLNSPDTPIYTKGKLLYGLNFCKNTVREKEELILVEGYTDFLSLYQAGIVNIAASLGTSLTPDQVTLAKRFAQRMVVCYDSDDPGINAALRAVSICFEKGVQIKIMNLPKGTDPDSFINKSGSEEFNKLAQKSTTGLKFLIDHQFREAHTDIPEEKAKIARNVWNEIKKIPDSIVLNEYIKKTSEYLSVDEETLRSMIQKKSTDERGEERDLFLNAEKRLLQILIEDKAIARYVFPEIKEEDLWGLNSKPIFMAFLEHFNKTGKILERHALKDKIEPSLLSSLSTALLEKEQAPSVEEAFECLNTLKQFSLENLSKELKAEIMKLEKQGKGEKILPLIEQLRDIKTQLSSLSERNYQNLSYNSQNISVKERS